MRRVGRANQINDLSKIVRKRVKAKLTTNSPTKRLYWRVNGDHSATAERRALFVLEAIVTEGRQPSKFAMWALANFPVRLPSGNASPSATAA